MTTYQPARPFSPEERLMILMLVERIAPRSLNPEAFDDLHDYLYGRPVNI